MGSATSNSEHVLFISAYVPSNSFSLFLSLQETLSILCSPYYLKEMKRHTGLYSPVIMKEGWGRQGNCTDNRDEMNYLN